MTFSLQATGYCQMVRIWSIHPRFLDRMGFLGLWREVIQIKNILEENRLSGGYFNHPQHDRYRPHGIHVPHSNARLDAYLHFLYGEAKHARNYNFNLKFIGAHHPHGCPECMRLDTVEHAIGPLNHRHKAISRRRVGIRQGNFYFPDKYVVAMPYESTIVRDHAKEWPYYRKFQVHPSLKHTKTNRISISHGNIYPHSAPITSMAAMVTVTRQKNKKLASSVISTTRRGATRNSAAADTAVKKSTVKSSTTASKAKTKTSGTKKSAKQVHSESEEESSVFEVVPVLPKKRGRPASSASPPPRRSPSSSPSKKGNFRVRWFNYSIPSLVPAFSRPQIQSQRSVQKQLHTLLATHVQNRNITPLTGVRLLNLWQALPTGYKCIPVTLGQVLYEWYHLLQRLSDSHRDPEQAEFFKNIYIDINYRSATYPDDILQPGTLQDVIPSIKAPQSQLIQEQAMDAFQRLHPGEYTPEQLYQQHYQPPKQQPRYGYVSMDFSAPEPVSAISSREEQSHHINPPASRESEFDDHYTTSEPLPIFPQTQIDPSSGISPAQASLNPAFSHFRLISPSTILSPPVRFDRSELRVTNPRWADPSFDWASVESNEVDRESDNPHEITQYNNGFMPSQPSQQGDIAMNASDVIQRELDEKDRVQERQKRGGRSKKQQPTSDDTHDDVIQSNTTRGKNTNTYASNEDDGDDDEDNSMDRPPRGASLFSQATLQTKTSFSRAGAGNAAHTKSKNDDESDNDEQQESQVQFEEELFLDDGTDYSDIDLDQIPIRDIDISQLSPELAALFSPEFEQQVNASPATTTKSKSTTKRAKEKATEATPTTRRSRTKKQKDEDEQEEQEQEQPKRGGRPFAAGDASTGVNAKSTLTALETFFADNDSLYLNLNKQQQHDESDDEVLFEEKHPYVTDFDTYGLPAWINVHDKDHPIQTVAFNNVPAVLAGETNLSTSIRGYYPSGDVSYEAYLREQQLLRSGQTSPRNMSPHSTPSATNVGSYLQSSLSNSSLPPPVPTLAQLSRSPSPTLEERKRTKGVADLLAGRRTPQSPQQRNAVAEKDTHILVQKLDNAQDYSASRNTRASINRQEQEQQQQQQQSNENQPFSSTFSLQEEKIWNDEVLAQDIHHAMLEADQIQKHAEALHNAVVKKQPTTARRGRSRKPTDLEENDEDTSVVTTSAAARNTDQIQFQRGESLYPRRKTASSSSSASSASSSSNSRSSSPAHSTRKSASPTKLPKPTQKPSISQLRLVSELPLDCQHVLHINDLIHPAFYIVDGDVEYIEVSKSHYNLGQLKVFNGLDEYPSL